MVVTFTLNPAVDRTINVSKLRVNSVNRVLSAHFDAGGHGINVCRALKVMGTETMACGFIGGQNGRMIKDFLSAASIPYDFIEVPGETRVNIKIVEVDGSHTDINDAGFTISDSDYDRLRVRMGMYIGRENIIALCGAPTPGFTVERYGDLCRLLTGRGARLIVDTQPDYMLKSLESRPVFVNPGLEEFSALMDREVTEVDEIVAGARELIGKGAQNVAIGMNERGAVFVSAAEALFITAPKVPIVGPVGAGAVLVAGICHGLENNMDFESLARYAVAAGTASVTVEGTGMAPRREIVRLYEKMHVDRI